MATTLQLAPSTCSMSPLLVEVSLRPTARTSVGDSATTPWRKLATTFGRLARFTPRCLQATRTRRASEGGSGAWKSLTSASGSYQRSARERSWAARGEVSVAEEVQFASHRTRDATGTRKISPRSRVALLRHRGMCLLAGGAAQPAVSGRESKSADGAASDRKTLRCGLWRSQLRPATPR